MYTYVTTKGEQTTLRWYCDTWGVALRPKITFACYDDFASGRPPPAQTTILADLERLDAAGLERAERLRAALIAAGCQVLNRPLKAARRYELLRRLYEAGINDFDAYRLTEARRPRRWPVFLRHEHNHTAPLTELLHDQASLDAAVEKLLAAGHSRDDKLIVEYADTADAMGVHHRFTAFRLGPRIVPAYVDYCRHWVVKDETEEAPFLEGPEHVEAERRYILDNPHDATLMEIFELASIDYGRVDYAVVDGRFKVFEINTNPMVLDFLDVGDPIWRENAELLAERFQAAFEALPHSLGARRPILAPACFKARARELSRRLRSGLHALLRLSRLLGLEARLVAQAQAMRRRMIGW